MHPEFKTSDIVLAAALKLVGFQLDNIEKVGSKGTFIFKMVSQDFLSDFNLSKVRVEPVQFNNMIRQLTTSVKLI